MKQYIVLMFAIIIMINSGNLYALDDGVIQLNNEPHALELNLSRSGQANADVFINGNLIAENIDLSGADISQGVYQAFEFSILETIQTVVIRYNNDNDGGNLYIRDIVIDGNVYEANQGEITFDNGTTSSKAGTLYTNGIIQFTFVESQLLTVNLSRSGQANADIFVNDELVSENLDLRAADISQGIYQAFEFTIFETIQTVVIRYDNDIDGGNLYVRDIAVDDNIYEANQGEITFDNGVTSSKAGTLYTNGIMQFTFAKVVEIAPSKDVEAEVDWGGLNPSLYRNDYAGRNRSKHDDGSENTITITVAIGTENVSDWIQHAIWDVERSYGFDQHITIYLEEGDHFFEKTLRVHRDNITIKGAGKNKTTIVGDFAGDNIIEFRPTYFNARFDSARGVEVTKTIGDFKRGDTTLNVADTSGLSVGDHIFLIHPDINDTGILSLDNHRSMAEITSIASNTLHLKHRIAFDGEGYDVNILDLLEGIAIKDFSVTHNITADMIYDNPDDGIEVNIDNIADFAGYNFVSGYATKNTSNTAGELRYGYHRAIVIAGTHETNMENITFRRIGSNAFFSGTNMELYANNITFDKTYNRGTGGNGYGYELLQSFYNDIENLNIYDMRHGVTYNLGGMSAYNNIHIKNSDTNIDFHGGVDKSNIYYVENMIFDPIYKPRFDSSAGQWTDEIISDSQIQWRLIELRHEDNEADNTFGFAQAISVGELNNPNNLSLVTQHHHFGDTLYAVPNGSILYGGAGNDKLYAGTGTDQFIFTEEKSGGWHNAESSFHEIFNFDLTRDKILIVWSTNGIETSSNALEQAEQIGNDVRIELGAQDAILRNTDLSALSVNNFEIVEINLSDFSQL